MTQLRHTIPDDLYLKLLKHKTALQKNSSKDITFTDALVDAITNGLDKK